MAQQQQLAKQARTLCLDNSYSKPNPEVVNGHHLLGLLKGAVQFGLHFKCLFVNSLKVSTIRKFLEDLNNSAAKSWFFLKLTTPINNVIAGILSRNRVLDTISLRNKHTILNLTVPIRTI